MAVVEMTPEFIETVGKLAGNSSVNFSGVDGLGEFYFVSHWDLAQSISSPQFLSFYGGQTRAFTFRIRFLENP
jgi:hypothetical protein